MEIKDVENLAELARIELSEGEKGTLLKDLGSILDYVKQIESIKMSEVEQESRIYNVWREDLPASGGRDSRDFSRDLLISQFPDSQDGFLKVKKIL